MSFAFFILIKRYGVGKWSLDRAFAGGKCDWAGSTTLTDNDGINGGLINSASREFIFAAHVMHHDRSVNMGKDLCQQFLMIKNVDL
jgi:hypothetical protein